MAWQKHRKGVWEGSRGDLPQLAVGLAPARGQPIVALPRWGSKPPEEGSCGRVSAASLAGIVRKINHRIEPKSNKQAQKYLVRKAADTEPYWYIRNQMAPTCPRFSPAARTGASACPPSTLPKHQQQPGYALVRVISSSWTLVLLPEMPYFLYLFTNCLGS